MSFFYIASSPPLVEVLLLVSSQLCLETALLLPASSFAAIAPLLSSGRTHWLGTQPEGREGMGGKWVEVNTQEWVYPRGILLTHSTLSTFVASTGANRMEDVVWYNSFGVSSPDCILHTALNHVTAVLG